MLCDSTMSEVPGGRYSGGGRRGGGRRRRRRGRGFKAEVSAVNELGDNKAPCGSDTSGGFGNLDRDSVTGSVWRGPRHSGGARLGA